MNHANPLRAVVSLVALGLMLASTLAHAGSELASDDPRSQADAGAPIKDSAASTPVKVEFSAGTGNKQAAIKIDLLNLSRSHAARPAVVSNALTLTISTPWDGENDSVPIGLDGLSNGTAAKLEFLSYVSKRANGVTSEQLAIAEEAITACRTKANSDFAGYLAELGVYGTDMTNPGRIRLDKLHGEALKSCTDTEISDVIGLYLPSKLRRYSTQAFTSDLYAFGFHGAVGYHKFGFVDPATAIKGSQKNTSWSAGISATDYFRSSPTALTVSFDYEHAYKEQDKQIFCPPASGTAPVQCVQDHAGPPNADNSGIVRLNLRHRFMNADGKGRFAVSPNVAYDAFDNEWAFDLPVYFLPGKDGTLTGGFRAGYTTEKKEATFGIFIGAAFGLWGE